MHEQVSAEPPGVLDWIAVRQRQHYDASQGCGGAWWAERAPGNSWSAHTATAGLSVCTQLRSFCAAPTPPGCCGDGCGGGGATLTDNPGRPLAAPSASAPACAHNEAQSDHHHLPRYTTTGTNSSQEAPCLPVLRLHTDSACCCAPGRASAVARPTPRAARTEPPRGAPRGSLRSGGGENTASPSPPVSTAAGQLREDIRARARAARARERARAPGFSSSARAWRRLGRTPSPRSSESRISDTTASALE